MPKFITFLIQPLKSDYNFSARLSVLAGLMIICTHAAAAEFVGSLVCSGCHQSEFELWQQSDHRMAMQPANPDTVLGDFDDQRFLYNGIESRFEREENHYFVTTDGADGAVTRFPVSYTFGYYPLQQYLIEFPDGRIQALSIAWDSREQAEGGQRWFHLYPDEALDHADLLHWTHFSHNWNANCADCHTTNLTKNYDPKTDSYATQWSEISVGCEACHGAGSNHVEWASQQSGTIADGNEESAIANVPFSGFEYSLVNDLTWLREAGAAAAIPDSAHKPVEQQLCAACHSLRTRLTQETSPAFYDHFQIQLLDNPLYFADGQIREEVFVYGSFLQSKMHAAGVTCGNCHEPHSQQLVAEGNAVCAQCHDPFQFDTTQHHHHPVGGVGSQCVDCHMPARTFMQVDARRDHQFMVPRPDLNQGEARTNACGLCHLDGTQNPNAPLLSSQQLTELFSTWYPERAAERSFAEALYPVWEGIPGARSALAEFLRNEADQIRPVQVGTALQHLDPASTSDLIQHYLGSSEALTQIGTLRSLQQLPLAVRESLVFPLLDNPAAVVRRNAVRLLARDDRLDPVTDPAYRSAVEEYFAQTALNQDSPFVLLERAQTEMALGRYFDSENTLLKALEIESDYSPLLLNLADLYRATGRENLAGETLRSGVSLHPESASLKYSLALHHVRSGDVPAAVEYLRDAVQIEPENPAHTYVLAVALAELDRSQEAITVLQNGLEYSPYSRDLLFTLVLYLAQSGNLADAREQARTLISYYPDDPQVIGLASQLGVSQ